METPKTLKKLSKINEKIEDLKSKLNSLHPSQSFSAFRYSLAPISMNLQEVSCFSELGGRVHCISWGGHGSSKNPEACNMLVSATDEGEVTVWNVEKSRVLHKVHIYSSDPCLMCCTFESSEGSLIASGGMEGTLHLFKLLRKSGTLTISEHPVISIHSHDNYLSRCQFLTSIQVLTASGDPEIKLWPVETRPEPIRVFSGHTEDVLGLAVSPVNPAVFVSGSCDGHCKIWDVRSSSPVVWSHWWPAGHVNSTKFMHESETTVMAGNSVLGVKVFDLRSARELSHFSRNVQVTDVEFSKSGRAAFVADSKGKVKVWDLLDDRLAVQVLSCDVEALSCVSLSPSGETLASAGLGRGISIFRSHRPGD